MNGTIEWYEDSKGQGWLVLRQPDGTPEALPYDGGPIKSSTDSHAIASLFGSFDHVEHDKEYIHVS